MTKKPPQNKTKNPQTIQNPAMNHILSNYLTKEHSNNILVYVMFYFVCEEYDIKMRQSHFSYLK